MQVLNADVDVANDSITLITQIQTLENAKRDLKVVINDMEFADFKVDTSVNFIPMLKVEGFIEEYLLNNVSILQVEKSLEISDYDKKISKRSLARHIEDDKVFGFCINSGSGADRCQFFSAFFSVLFL